MAIETPNINRLIVDDELIKAIENEYKRLPIPIRKKRSGLQIKSKAKTIITKLITMLIITLIRTEVSYIL